MKATNLNVFYQLGASITYLVDHVHIGDQAADLFTQIHIPCQWLVRFRTESDELEDTFKDTCAAVEGFIKLIHDWMDSIPADWNRLVTQDEMRALFYWKEKFEEAFEREQRNLDVFTVTPKGLYNTRLLIETPENDFPKEFRVVLPKQMLYDMQQAARCLAFDVPTACAFHVCRGTESLMLAYYARLAKHEWNLPKNRDWSQYIDHLKKKGAPAKITDRLKEIKDSDRNALIHPDINVRPDEAHILFKLCTAVNFYMAEEIVKLTP
jgi:hypothetical protein